VCPLQDGGILTNNPCGVAIHEARLLWGSSVPIQTVVSLGTGLKYLNTSTSTKDMSSTNSFREKVIKVVEGATDTESMSYQKKTEKPYLLVLSSVGRVGAMV